MTAHPELTWRLGAEDDLADITVSAAGNAAVTPEWAWQGATGRGVRVCVVDSGVDRDHPLLAPVQATHAVVTGPGGKAVVRESDAADTCGHGTACAGIIRSIAPECELHSVQVLGAGFSGTGDAFVTGLRWAIEQGFDVVSLSLSTSRRHLAEPLRELGDLAYFRRTVLVASAHNLPVESFPWRFSSVISVGSHAGADPGLILYNPRPPVEFFAHGSDVEVAWPGGGRTRCTGNSFATPHVAAHCALILSKHPGLTPFQVKTVLYLTAQNVRKLDDGER
ncbi:S8 family serine peptidase [Streptosporangium sp. NPDC049248]|uniref:S8 family peptidase n=1 Tax=Streptosporangium sp. NPDC049248 TaxID=3155651 RepID=UPI00342C0E5A